MANEGGQGFLLRFFKIAERRFRDDKNFYPKFFSLDYVNSFDNPSDFQRFNERKFNRFVYANALRTQCESNATTFFYFISFIYFVLFI